MVHEVVIDRRYCGPAESGNGGYTCGLLADALGGADVEVTLVAPPPLETLLTIELLDGEARLLDSGRPVATARRTGQVVTVPPNAPGPVEPAIARDAASVFDVDSYRSSHEFPSCFTCGPDRSHGDGLRIFPAVIGRSGRTVWPWTPSPDLFDDTGKLPVAVLWAALDCPSGQAWITLAGDPVAIVLGRMAASIERAPTRDEALVVMGWTGEPDGRRRPAGSAIYDDTGHLVAAAATTWIVLTEEQRIAFRSTSTSG